MSILFTFIAMFLIIKYVSVNTEELAKDSKECIEKAVGSAGYATGYAKGVWEKTRKGK